jgi:hypothetical protein
MDNPVNRVVGKPAQVEQGIDQHGMEPPGFSFKIAINSP